MMVYKLHIIIRYLYINIFDSKRASMTQDDTKRRYVCVPALVMSCHNYHWELVLEQGYQIVRSHFMLNA